MRWIVAPSAVGSLQEQIRPLDIVVPDQFIDRTNNRPATFFNEGAVAHVTMGDPFCRNLSGNLSNVGEKNMNEAMRHLSRSLRYFYGGDYRASLQEVESALDLFPNLDLLRFLLLHHNNPYLNQLFLNKRF